MGANGWFHAVAYREDVSAALEDLRWKVFLAWKAPRRPRRLPPFAEWVKQMPPEWADDLTRLRAEYDDLARRESLVPASPDELLEVRGADGTGTVIDMVQVADAPGHGRVAPWPAEPLRAAFGTDRPTLAQLKQGRSGLERAKWSGSVVVCYARGEPRWLCFFGVSGD